MATVLLLGATSDMAVAMAKKFAAEGYDLQLAARNTERMSSMQSDLMIRFGISCTLHEFDATDMASHRDFYSGLPTEPDISICVFGYMGDNESAWHNWKECHLVLTSNYVGAVSILNLISNAYAARKSGVIVGVSSVAGERGRQSNFFYGSAKAGFTAYLSGLRNRMFREHVHVLTIKPGFVYTKMTESLSLPKLLTAQPEEVANATYRAVQKKQNVIYVRWFWRWIMLLIKSIPEFLFKKLKL